MKITFLGTAAAEGWPAMFCRCEPCLKAMKAGGRNIRTRSQALVNDDLLIDFPADSLQHLQQNALDFSAVTTLIVTHSHFDHFVPVDLHLRNSAYFAHNLTADRLELFGNERVLEILSEDQKTYAGEPVTEGLAVHPARAWQPFRSGRYDVIPLLANHTTKENALNYVVSDGEKTLLYLHDTGLPFEETYDFLRERKIRADLVSYDCTFGPGHHGATHLGLPACAAVRERLEEIGVSDENTLSVVNHFSHNGKAIYDEIAPAAEQLGFLTAYDGMTVRF